MTTYRENQHADGSTSYHWPRGDRYHRVWRYADGRVSIYDYSGNRPENTEDGPLIIEPGTVCEAYKWQGHILVRVPVTSSSGSSCHVDIPVFDLLMKLVPGLKVQADAIVDELKLLLSLASHVDEFKPHILACAERLKS